MDRRSFITACLALPLPALALKPLHPPEYHNDVLGEASPEVDAAWSMEYPGEALTGSEHTDYRPEPSSRRVLAAVERVMRGRKFPGSLSYRMRLEHRAREHEAMYLPAERDWRMAELWADGYPRTRLEVLD